MRKFGILIMLSFIIKFCSGGGRHQPSLFAFRLSSPMKPSLVHVPSTCMANNSIARSYYTCSNSKSSVVPPHTERSIKFMSALAASSSSYSDRNIYYENEGEEGEQSALPNSSYNNNNNQRHAQNPPPQVASAILSTRALYQFSPLRPGSTRGMPPSVSDYDDSYEYDITDEDSSSSKSSSSSSGGYENTMNVDDGDVSRPISSHVYPDNSGDKEEDGNFFDDDVKEVKLVKSTPKVISKNKIQAEQSTDNVVESSLPKKKYSSSETTKDTASSPSESTSPNTSSMSSMSKPSFPRVKARAVVTPSFMEPQKTKSMVNLNNEYNTDERNIPTEASNGNGSMSHLTTLTHQLDHLTTQIYQLNKGVEFNVNSPKQVANILFGENNTGDSSTNKDVLEAMASAGNEMAACIYKYRKLSREIKREKRRIEQQEKGDKKNDYYGNLARRDSRKINQEVVESQESANAEDVQIFENVTTQSSQPPDGVTTDINPKREPLLLIDASAYIFRAYYAIPPLHHSDGTPTGALHGVCRMLQNLLLTRLLKGERPRVVLAFDFKGPNFRHELYSDYKANRKDCPEDLIPQFDLVREAAEAFGVVQVEAEGYEADDVIATLAMQALNDGVDVDILSGDKDLMQLITPPGIEPSVHMIDPMHFDRVDHDDVVKKWGVSSDKLGDVLALAGDASDNIPGAPGIGPKIASTLINDFGSLSNLLAEADTIKQNKRRESIMENVENVLLFRKLVTLDESIPLSKMTLPPSFQDVSSLRMSTFDPTRLIDYYKRMELNSCQIQLERRLRSTSVSFKKPPTPEEFENVPF